MTLSNARPRHASTEHLLGLFEYGHLPGHLRAISAPCADLAVHLVDLLEDGPELTVALRKLLEAKDCAVRQAVIDTRAEHDARTDPVAATPVTPAPAGMAGLLPVHQHLLPEDHQPGCKGPRRGLCLVSDGCSCTCHQAGGASRVGGVRP